MDHDIRDLGLAEVGRQRIEWAARHMPVLRRITGEFASDRPLAGRRIAVSLHITTETAVLLRALRAGGAEIALCASNPLSTKDDVCAALVEDGMAVYARYGEDLATYEPAYRADAGDRPAPGDRRRRRPDRRAASAAGRRGGARRHRGDHDRRRSRPCAGRPTGVSRFPVIAVNDTPTKRMFDNRYGTGQNTIDGILRATNVLLAGAIFVVAGYGWCGRGIAMRARGMGARVIVSEVNAIRALEAVMDGYEVLPMAEAAPLGDVFVTATGMAGVIRVKHLLLDERRRDPGQLRPLRRRGGRRRSARTWRSPSARSANT